MRRRVRQGWRTGGWAGVGPGRAGGGGVRGGAAVPGAICGVHGQALPRAPASLARLRLGLHLDQERCCRAVVWWPRPGGAGRTGASGRAGRGGDDAASGRSRHAWLAGAAPLDLVITLDDATSAIYSAILVAEEGTASTFAGWPRRSWRRACPAPSTPTGAAITFTRPRRAARWRGTADPGRTGTGTARHRAHRGVLAGGAGPLGACIPDPAGPAAEGAGAGRDHRRSDGGEPLHPRDYLPAHNARFAVAPAEAGSAFVPWPRRSGATCCASRRNARWPCSMARAAWCAGRAIRRRPPCIEARRVSRFRDREGRGPAPRKAVNSACYLHRTTSGAR